ncbi:hypothetical protein PENSPDRAFT_585458 [Peniophora sp. CONT]|nr:hypothetical protein PENSPDRAFT_585458 [Peniophora sp. CONT]
MSRLPQPSSSRTPVKSTPSRTRTTSTVSATTSRLNAVSPSPASRFRTPSPSKPAPESTSRTTTPTSSRIKPAAARVPASVRASPSKPKPKPAEPAAPPAEPPARLSLKEQIALKRAEAKKAQQKSGPVAEGEWAGLEEAAPDTFGKPPPEEELGRWSIRETIERARMIGQVNLATRELKCLPSALFEIHLGITPEKLALVPDEPPLPERVRKGSTQDTTWFEQQDLAILKAWSNEIVEIHPEIALFGSLKIIDLHNNKLTTLPDAFADLPKLATLDLSHNELTSLPSNFFALPSIVTLDLSHNALTSLPFNEPFAGSNPPAYQRKDDYFAPAVVRADRPMPMLASLTASHNHISASAVDLENVPLTLAKLDLSENPLTNESEPTAREFLVGLARLPALEEVRLTKAVITESSFPDDLLSSVDSPFPKLKLLDMEESFHVRHTDAVQRALATISAQLIFASPPVGPSTPSLSEPTNERSVLHVVIGKKVQREAWEIEADRRAQMRKMRSAGNLRAQNQEDEAPLPSSTAATPAQPRAAPVSKKEVVKEQWEIEAEQGLLTEGGRRRARALAAQREKEEAERRERELAEKREQEQREPSASPTHERESSSPAASTSTLNPKYYDNSNKTLMLPPCAPVARHARNFSLAIDRTRDNSDLTLPNATLPLALIATQPFASTLRFLELRGRRADTAFLLPTEDVSFPRLEELILDGCSIPDEIPAAIGDGLRERKPTLPLLARLFPTLRSLDLSYNNISSAALPSSTLSALVLADGSSGRAGLRALRLRGNRLENLGGLAMLARTAFVDGAEDKDGIRGRWTLEELDVRDNALEALPGELGLLPLEVFLVEGNVYVPFLPIAS